MINYKCKDFELNEIEDSTNIETTKLFKVSASEINSLNLLKKLQSGSQLYFDIHSVITAFWGDGDYIINPYLDIDARDNSVMIAVKVSVYRRFCYLTSRPVAIFFTYSEPEMFCEYT